MSLSEWDLSLFRSINAGMSNPWFDQLMPFLSGNALFIPAVTLGALFLLYRGGRRGRIFVVMMFLVFALGEGFVTGPLKKSIQRPRPFVEHQETIMRAGVGESFAMPSGHSALWAAITTVTWIYYRKYAKWVAPVALGVGFSRIYNGVHYPSDVVVGFAVGFGYAVGIIAIFQWGWRLLGRRFWPQWWVQLPDLWKPLREATNEERRGVSNVTLDQHWIGLGYFVVGVLLTARWALLASGKILLSEDEAYQWVWSKHLALSYFSKPPLIAYTQWLGTHLAGDTEFGVRMFSPLLSAILSITLLHWVAARTRAAVGFFFVLAMISTPLLGVGSLLMTIDPLTVFFWTIGMLTGWQALRSGELKNWVFTGICLSGSFLSKYFCFFQWAAFALYFWWEPTSRRHWRTSGPWVTLAINGLGMIPVLVWNAQNHWIGLGHLKDRGGLERAWEPTLRYFWDFLIAVPILLNPVWFFLGIYAAWWTLVRVKDSQTQGGIDDGDERPRLLRYLFCMSIPILVFYWAYTFRARVQPNWVCAAILPGMLLAVLVLFHETERKKRWPRLGWVAGVLLGLPVVILLHNTRWVSKLGFELSVAKDPQSRVRGHTALGELIDGQFAELEKTGKQPFVIADHYGRAGLISFYWARAKKAFPETRWVYELSTEVPKSQYALWPGYSNRKGHDALFVSELVSYDPIDEPLPERLLAEFESVEKIGLFPIKDRGKTLRWIQLARCRNLR